ncbi:uncharacterized protein LOC131616729 isoform X2 [Vicia villosa]|uniref:uncharacterized protein LOC131616729 isoform X2 n=1 Tax=Vicia villosa TaxID=3911 RepID=UPI00273BB293|nr:uncharacterized protein LOC131616729 isoform X2 [Vicia villosa]
MGSIDRSDVRTFKANFTAEGVTVLREKLNEKLKELMGNYTDETLVDYVIVLLRNGRGKDHAKNKLNVFLGEDSDSFVSWLWDHLALNIDLYVESIGLQDEAPKSKLISKVQAGDDGFQNLNSKSERVKSRSRRNRDWKGLVCREAEAPPLQSFVVDCMHLDKKVQSKVNRAPRPRPPSPAPPVQRKRGCAFEEQKTKRDSVSQVTVDAPRRLLQFAVRDAVATSRPSNLGSSVEPSLKRLRSVVSSSSVESSMVEHPHRMQTISRVANPMATLFKAVEEAAEDVVKLQPSRSVFDRIGCDMYPSYGNLQLEDNQYQEQSPLLYHKEKDYGDQYAANMTMLEHETGFSSNSSSDNEGFDDVNFTDNRVGRVSQLSSSGGKRGEDSLMVHYNVAKNDNNRMLLKKNRNQEQSAAAPNTSKIVNISVNVNAWNPPVPAQYQKPREVAELSGYKTLNSGIGAPRSGLRMVNENAKTLKVDNGKVKPTLNLLKETQKAQPSTPGTGSSAASCPLFDADSRTIFASNVHFAATKDAICRHFNKFGEVLKAVIVTDSITGQPKGAVYVEFMHKEAADNALSLDGTSFMSRILKVVRKSTAQHQDYAPAVPCLRGVKRPPYPSASFLRSPIPTGIAGAFRPRPPIKFGARSLQWKRGVQGGGTSSDNGATLNNSSISAPVSRGLTYVRAESKLNGSVSTR